MGLRAVDHVQNADGDQQDDEQERQPARQNVDEEDHLGHEWVRSSRFRRCHHTLDCSRTFAGRSVTNTPRCRANHQVSSLISAPGRALLCLRSGDPWVHLQRAIREQSRTGHGVGGSSLRGRRATAPARSIGRPRRKAEHGKQISRWGHPYGRLARGGFNAVARWRARRGRCVARGGNAPTGAARERSLRWSSDAHRCADRFGRVLGSSGGFMRATYCAPSRARWAR